MLIASTIRSEFAQRIRPAIESPKYVAAFQQDGTEAESDVSLSNEKLVLDSRHTLSLTQSLPSASFHTWSTSSLDGKFLKELCQEHLIPGLATALPGAAPFIKGGLLIWASKDFYDFLSEEDDPTKRLLEGTEFAIKASEYLLQLQGSPPSSMAMLKFSSICLGTANKTYLIRTSNELGSA